ncbi:MAG TPA: PH domain-containing protein [Mycobacteriales bacterium]|nr:PH domain-containing protein [Mycobacteriales bacterium]
MSYPDKLLVEDERVAKHLHPHWITLVVPVLIFLIDVGLGTFLATIVPDGSAKTPLRLVIAVVGVVILIWFVLVPLIRWRCTHYVVTTHRVLIRTGVLRQQDIEIQLRRLNDVRSVRTLADRLIGAGTLTLESAGEHGQETLRNVPKADQVQNLINRLSEEDANRRGGGYGPPSASPEDFTRRVED